MKTDESKSERKPTARHERVAAVAQQYQELLKLRRKVQSLEKKSKKARPH
jgi:uncharacterized protein YjiS (DUF1127 family)